MARVEEARAHASDSALTHTPDGVAYVEDTEVDVVAIAMVLILMELVPAPNPSSIGDDVVVDDD